MRKLLVCVLAALFVIGTSGLSYAKDYKLEKRMDEAAQVLDEIMQMPEQSIPKDLLDKAAAILIFPSAISGGFIFGGKLGSGVGVYRDKDTGKWSAPCFFNMGGGSFGLQIGGAATDLVLVITSKRGVEGLLKDNVTLGGDAAATAGPVGRNAKIETDLLLKAGILSYSRSKGLFAGISLQGAVLGPNKEFNKSLYGRDITAEEIFLTQKVAAPQSAQKLLNTVVKYAGGTK